MKYFLLSLACFLSVSPPCRADELSDAVHGVLKQASASVVRIQTVGTGADLEVDSEVTTGVVLSESGFVLSSAFGFGGQTAGIFVTDNEGDTVTAQVVARDNLRKLVLLKCASGKFRPAEFANRQLQIGEYAIAAGRLYQTKLPNASVGIISALNRIHGLAIQTDAKISPVNYGGPLLDLQGKVMGILVPLSPRETGGGIQAGVEWYDSGIGFAIPARDALNVAKKLRDGKDLQPGILGVEPATQNPLSPNVSLKRIRRGSPAETAGLKSGDKIKSINGKPITRYGEFETALKSAYAEDQLSIVVERLSKTINADVTLVASLPIQTTGWLGLVTTGKSDAGKVEALVYPSSPLATAGMPDHVWIEKINKTKTKNVRAFNMQLENTVAGDEFEITWSDKPESENRSTKIAAVARPTQLSVVTPDFISEIVQPATDWKRDEIKTEDSKKNSWYYAPSKTAESVGLVVALSDSNTTPQEMLQRWKDVCEAHSLILLVVNNTEGTELTREDAETVGQTVMKLAQERKLDADRITLTCQRPQAELCLTVLLNPRAREFRKAVFLQSWPPTTNLSTTAVSVKSPQVLFLQNQGATKTHQALQNSAAKDLTKFGASTSLRMNDNRQAETIANWLFEQKIR